MSDNPPYPAAKAKALVETLRGQTEHLAGCIEDSNEERTLQRVRDALDVFDSLGDGADGNLRWSAAHLVHDASVLMADHLKRCGEGHFAEYAALVSAINAFESARDGDRDIGRRS